MVSSPGERMENYGALFGLRKPPKPRTFRSRVTNRAPSKTKHLEALEFQRHLRKHQTNAERRTKKALLSLFKLPETAKRHEYKQFFVDQFLVWVNNRPRYIDFLLVKGKIGIEIDGDYHNAPSQQTKDQQRTLELNTLKIKVRRITNWETKDPQILRRLLKNAISESHRITSPITEPPRPKTILRKRERQTIPDEASYVQPGVYMRFK